MNTFAFKSFVIVGLGIGLSASALAQTPSMASCEQIRTQIQAQVGIRTKPDTAMLDILSEHPECRFTAAEVFRAAFGDRPMPRNTRRDGQRNMRDDDD
ncbi:hypothetical protein [Denitromonas ohlonensis]|uniref:DUF3718 domain-containing protein n=2 Tax=Denitromonas TaxID=139331 RepID=A0A557S9Q7_9RHOO|nr:hypothetical protein [Denitromonas ohlonensis]TVO63624.1 hypothetical protein FHP90_14195 [Denitromonas ohlonensis]TVO74158.1 hypothetical protein FHP89_16175 [Denitromonas ohlonensis]TVT74401.1 MAG: hypothetical protein FHP92_13510 [Denitromonas halophila]